MAVDHLPVFVNKFYWNLFFFKLEWFQLLLGLSLLCPMKFYTWGKSSLTSP